MHPRSTAQIVWSDWKITFYALQTLTLIFGAVQPILDIFDILASYVRQTLS